MLCARGRVSETRASVTRQRTSHAMCEVVHRITYRVFSVQSSTVHVQATNRAYAVYVLLLYHELSSLRITGIVGFSQSRWKL